MGQALAGTALRLGGGAPEGAALRKMIDSTEKKDDRCYGAAAPHSAMETHNNPSTIQSLISEGWDE